MKINLGCGYRHQKGNEWVNIDNREECNPDLLWDIAANGLEYFENNSIEEVRAFDFIEHIPRNRYIYVMEEIYRVLIPNGIFEHFTPSDEGRGFGQDPTHVNPFNLNSIWYFQKDEYRNLYGIQAKFEGESKNVYTDVRNKIIHVYAKLIAIKE